MGKGRLEAFSDGVLAIIITIMVLELKVPSGETLAALRPLVPVLGSYVLSFVFIATYWNNHHHLFLATERVSGGVLWANMVLLFCLSLVPLGTAWMGDTHFAPAPTAVYSAILLMSALAYGLLQRAILATQGKDSLLGMALGSDRKGKGTLVILIVAIVCALRVPLVSAALCGLVDVIWLVPDRRIERALAAAKRATGE
jgi:TMEM175 potassium channel family protein